METQSTLIAPKIYLPLVGLGTWLLKGQKCTSTVKLALDLGYRHIDTAPIYDNHTAIGLAIAGFDREKLFLTSKFTLEQHAHIEKACDQALNELNTPYLDLYLLHYPDRSYDIASTMRQVSSLIEKQKIRALGVSNFTQKHLQDLKEAGIRVSVNQVEFHPYLNQKALLTYCKNNEIHLMSYRALGKGHLAADPTFEKMGAKYGKTPSQIILRWLIEKNISVIPKSSSKHHLEENISLFDFALTPDDHTLLDTMPEQHRFCSGEWTDFDYI